MEASATQSQSLSSDSSSDASMEETWVSWFCSLSGNEFFCEVQEEYIRDRFNLTGLEDEVTDFNEAIEWILGSDPDLTEDEKEGMEEQAEFLYGLIHARFIITSEGMRAMFEKYRRGHFGKCPRVMCDGQHVLPVGLADSPNMDTVKVYCPKCDDVYEARSKHHQSIDGGFFGTTFPHLFFLTYPELKPSSTKVEHYIPRVFGFRINKHAYKESLESERKEKEQAAALGHSNVVD